MTDVLDHPLLLLLVGALVSGLLLPWLARRWQNHQKELELKTQLTTEITETVTAFAMVLQFVELGASSQTQADFDDAYREWETNSAVIASKLSVYFGGTSLPDEWRRFSSFANDFYALAGTGEAKQTNTTSLLKLIDASRALPDADREELKRMSARGVEKPQVEWAALKAHVLAWKDAIVKDLLSARSVLTARRG
jgi:hypothetical protein